MTILLFALMLAQPEPTPAPQAPLRDEGPPERVLSPAHDLFEEDETRSRGLGRRVMHDFGSCVADNSARLAGETLTMDFTDPRYRRRMLQLAQNNSGCLRRAGRMRSAGLALAGAVAERLLESDPAPLNARLARAAQGTAAATFSPTDRIAMCVVRSVPDQVAQLFSSEIESGEERSAVNEMQPILAACNQDRTPFTASIPGLRAMLATAAFRSVQGLQPRAAD